MECLQTLVNFMLEEILELLILKRGLWVDVKGEQWCIPNRVDTGQKLLN